mgnify:CR=1 FL=1|tara:strand:+ start:43 stop:633 length:591 start_codon:yes stop_codon:yes gene_type:complete
MAVTLFDGPIPGQSLTDEPGNYPWERPPVHADPLDALEVYMDKLGNEDIIDDITDMLDLGIPINTVAGAMLSSGFQEGLHSIDVKFILKPLIAAQIQSIANVIGIDYKLDMSDYRDKDAERAEKRKRVLGAKLANMLDVSTNEMDEGQKIVQETQENLESMPEEDMQVEDTMQEGSEPMQMEEQQEAPVGLMAKGQ